MSFEDNAIPTFYIVSWEYYFDLLKNDTIILVAARLCERLFNAPKRQQKWLIWWTMVRFGGAPNGLVRFFFISACYFRF